MTHNKALASFLQAASSTPDMNALWLKEQAISGQIDAATYQNGVATMVDGLTHCTFELDPIAKWLINHRAPDHLIDARKREHGMAVAKALLCQDTHDSFVLSAFLRAI